MTRPWGATAGAAGWAGWAGTGYGIAGALIKSWNEAPAASAIVIDPTVDAVGGEFLKWNDWADKGLNLLQSRAGNHVDLHQRAANFLNGAIQRRAQTLMSTVAGPAQQVAQNNLDRFTAANYKANTAIGQARGAAAGIGVLRGFLCVYVAYNDIKGALEHNTKKPKRLPVKAGVNRCKVRQAGVSSVAGCPTIDMVFLGD